MRTHTTHVLPDVPQDRTEVDPVVSTSTHTAVVETCRALSRLHAPVQLSGVVTGGVRIAYQGTDLLFTGNGVVVDAAMPRQRKGGSSGTRAWSPPV
jgi:hypothetical protein